jgi:hypothetical protein
MNIQWIEVPVDETKNHLPPRYHFNLSGGWTPFSRREDIVGYGGTLYEGSPLWCFSAPVIDDSGVTARPLRIRFARGR